MILDALQRVSAYVALGPALARGLRFLRDRDLAALPDGRLALDGDRVFAIVSRYTPRAGTAGPWEAHRRYLDIQALAAGAERIGVADVDTLRVTHPYAGDRDCLLLAGRGTWFTLRPGAFAVFWPHDAHAPGHAAGRPAPVKKIVVKVRLDPR